MYSTIANCNYESNDSETGVIHAIRKALVAQLTDDQDLIDAMDALEDTLDAELSDSGEYNRGVLSMEACNAAEAAVLAAWTDAVQEAVEAERINRYVS